MFAAYANNDNGGTKQQQLWKHVRHGTNSKSPFVAIGFCIYYDLSFKFLRLWMFSPHTIAPFNHTLYPQSHSSTTP